MNKRKFFILIIILICIDQISKFLVVFNKDNLPKTIIKNFLNITYCENRGIAFGLASGYVQLFAIITLVIIVAILICVCINFKKINTFLSVGIGMLISGGVGNLIDRLIRSYVVDFIDFGDFINFPVFNIADIFVVIGVIVIGISCLKNEKLDV